MNQQQHIDTYEEALATLKRALAFGINPSLEGIRLLMEELGHPENSYVPIQITGTNGKTSTTRLIEALLRSSGFKSGFYTSPELIDYTERIQIEGADISREEFARGMQRVSDARDSLTQKGLYEGDQITEFELLTALALFIFAERHLDFAVLEVGLGGRWDATSVVAPSVAVITGVGLDHTNILGSSVQEIAADKAMIIKPGSTPVLGAHLGEALDVILKRCEDLEAFPRVVCDTDEVSPVLEELTTRIDIHTTEKDTQTLLRTRFSVKTSHANYENLLIAGPAYQAYNASTALTAVEAALGRALMREDIDTALATVRFPARFEVVRRDPLLMFDGGHNPQAAELLAKNLQQAGIKPVAVLGVFADKDYEKIIAALKPGVAGFIAISIDHPRALGAQELAANIEKITGVAPRATLVHPTLADILELTKSQPVVITGSLSLYVLLKSYIAHTKEKAKVE